jgi:23S rRNA pseudouridine1911/1915/1917 synthase
MEIISSHIVPLDLTPVRLTDYILQISEDFLPGTVSRNYVKKLIKKGLIFVDGKPGSTAVFVQPGMKIEVQEENRKPVKIYNLKIPVIFEDDYLAVINKPSGIIVSGNRFRTIENALLNNIKTSTQADAFHLPRSIHRLDALTSGLLIVAKTKSVRRELGEMLQNRKIDKTYRAIVMGKTPESGSIDLSINGQKALTEYRRIRTVPSLKSKWLSLLEIYPRTGRTHQLRIHFYESGFPILGDKLYGNKATLFKGKGLFLAATGLKFQHPVYKNTIELRITEPGKFQLHLDREEKRWRKYNIPPDSALQL